MIASLGPLEDQKSRLYPYLLGLLLLLLIGCGPAEPTIQATATAPQTVAEPTVEQEEPAAEETAADEAYPPPTITSPPLPEAAYPVGEETPTPAAAEEAYPAPEATEPTGTPLVLDKPIEVGTTLVEGSGPSGLRVVLVNVTQMGLELGSAVIGDDGRFAIEVDPLPAGVRIGLTADLGAAGLSEADVQPGDGEIAIPRVGYFFDSFVIPQ